MRDKREFSASILDAYAKTGLPEEFRFVAASSERPAEIIAYGVIGDEITDTALVAALEQAGDGPLVMRVNSPGGSVTTGYALYNALKRRGNVTVVVDGMAASAAAFMAMGADRVIMAETSLLMIHNSWSLVVGDRNAMLETAATMELIDGQQAAMFSAKTGLPVDVIATMLDDETWMTATKALELKFADEISEVVTSKPKKAAQVRAEADEAAPENPVEEPKTDAEVERRRRLVRLADEDT